MGHDNMAVTDGEGLVHGMTGLRVVDGSILPYIPTANVNAPRYHGGQKKSPSQSRQGATSAAAAEVGLRRSATRGCAISATLARFGFKGIRP